MVNVWGLMSRLAGLWVILVAQSHAWGAEVYGALEPSWFKQNLTVLGEDTYRIRKTASAKSDCEFAAAVIERYSRPEMGLMFRSRCTQVAGVHDFVINTEVWIDRSLAPKGKAFRKLSSRMVYRNGLSAKYAQKILKKLNFHQCNVLLDPTVGVSPSGTSLVQLDTVAMIGSSGVKPARKITQLY